MCLVMAEWWRVIVVSCSFAGSGICWDLVHKWGMTVVSLPFHCFYLTCSLSFLLVDPWLWSEQQVCQWLLWATNEFSLVNVNLQRFGMNGQMLCNLGKERFLELAPDFVGDILWEHLEQMIKGTSWMSCFSLSRMSCGREDWLGKSRGCSSTLGLPLVMT